MRTHYCGLVTEALQGQSVSLCGWVNRRRDHGGVIFIDLRDREGYVQVVCDPDRADMFKVAEDIRNEFCVQIKGLVRLRPEGTINEQLKSGKIEVLCHELVVLNPSVTPPFQLDDDNLSETTRLTHRVLDLRRPYMQKNLMLRYRVSMAVRKFLDANGFVDIETPMLTKSTPEGARDYLVPSRVNDGHFFALPQSPQLFKQLLMVSGFDRYYQITKCFRDEDLRADRQPEFTQIDCEMAFVEQEDILNTFEGLLRHVLSEVHGVKLTEVPRMTYDEAMRRYGNDKPDIRFGMEFVELTGLVKGQGFPVFDQAELVVGLNAKGCGTYSRKQLDALTDFVKRPQLGMTGLIWMRLDEQGLPSSSVNKFFDESALKNWAEAFGAEPGDLVLVLAGAAGKTRKALSELRLHLGQELGLRKPFEFAPLWVVDFPLLEWDEDSSRWFAMHHPFTSPKPEDIALLETDPGAVRANAYDIVLNGNEIGGGSIRIHDRSLQARMLELLGFSPEEAQAQFGFLMNAFEYGAPPHGGIAFGFDRLVALMGGDEVIRDYIAFPKNNSGRDVMIDAPAAIAEAQMQELNLLLRPSTKA